MSISKEVAHCPEELCYSEIVATEPAPAHPDFDVTSGDAEFQTSSTITPSPSALCSDTAWTDSWGDDYGWYQLHDSPGCPTYRISFSSTSGSVKEHCCYLWRGLIQGGRFNSEPYSMANKLTAHHGFLANNGEPDSSTCHSQSVFIVCVYLCVMFPFPNNESESSESSTCVDTPDWVDSMGDGCLW